jgi:NADH dehydrogenase [ubiquinone] 1 alpha subcomplex assembly factor 5
MSSSFGGNTLQELRISFNLAEQERDGGVSPVVSPMLSAVDLGNIFARVKFTMPTVDITHTVV